MTLDELRTEVERRRALGHEYLQIVISRENNPKNWDRVFLMHGLYGRIVGRLPMIRRWKFRYLVDVRIADVEARLGRSNGYDLQRAEFPHPDDRPC